MASVVELGNLANLAYEGITLRYRSYIRGMTFGNRGFKGFYAELWLNRDRNEAVLAIRGTDGGKDHSDHYSDWQIALGAMPNQSKEAEKAYTAAKVFAEARLSKNFTFVFTGHSLGGGLATILSAKNRLPVVTFNAPGMARSLIYKKDIYGASGTIDAGKMLHIRASGDVISSATGPHIGRVDVLTVPLPAYLAKGPERADRPVSNSGISTDTGEETLIPGNGVNVKADTLQAAYNAKYKALVIYEQHRMVNLLEVIEGNQKYREPFVWQSDFHHLPNDRVPAF